MSSNSAPIRWLKFLVGTSPSARDLHSPVAAVRFTLVATAIYALLMSPQLNLQARFAPLFRTFGNKLFANGFGTHDEASVHFFDAGAKDLFDQVNRAFVLELPRSYEKNIPRAQGEKDTLLLLQSTEKKSGGFLRTGARLMAFTPAAILLAIVLATPCSLRRRTVLFACSFILLAAFVAFRLSILVVHGGFAVPQKSYHLYEPSDFWRDVLNRVYTVVCDNPTFHYVAPIIIWAVVVVGLSFVAYNLQVRQENSLAPKT